MTMISAKALKVVRRLTKQPADYPPIGYKFEMALSSPDMILRRGYEHVFEYEVVGWELHEDGVGNQDVSVRCKLIGDRLRHVRSIRFEVCNLGHQHEVFDLEGAAPYGTVPDRFGYGGMTNGDNDQTTQG